MKLGTLARLRAASRGHHGRSPRTWRDPPRQATAGLGTATRPLGAGIARAFCDRVGVAARSCEWAARAKPLPRLGALPPFFACHLATPLGPRECAARIERGSLEVSFPAVRPRHDPKCLVLQGALVRPSAEEPETCHLSAAESPGKRAARIVGGSLVLPLVCRLDLIELCHVFCPPRSRLLHSGVRAPQSTERRRSRHRQDCRSALPIPACHSWRVTYERDPTVLLLGTLDTKGKEYAYLRELIRRRGVDVLLVDAGILGEPLAEPDVTRHEVAAAGGARVEALAEERDRSAAIEAMSHGAAEVVLRLHAEGRFDAIGALGGTGGTALATHAMQRLPIGVPKLMVSTAASGNTQRYFGPVDITMTYSVVDIAGLNSILTGILRNAAGALVGMATTPVSPPPAKRPVIVASMFGVTTPCVTVARERLEELGYEVLVFHQVGLGGQSLEEVVKAGGVAGVLDVTPGGLADEIAGGIWPACPERVETAGSLGLPQIVSLGGLDFVSIGPPEPLPARFGGRTLYIHDNVLAATRLTPEESRQVAAALARKLNAATGPTVLYVPLRGVSLLSTMGAVLADAEADEALFSCLRESVDEARVEVHEVDSEINDPQFALAMANRLHELIAV
jgi:uncharacterized protein (UPF0261 family)